MAEQTVRYRVELDDSDLAQQLQSIRSKLNSEVSSLAPSVPTAAAFDASQIYSAPLSFTPPALPAEGSYPTVMAPAPSFQSFDNANTGFASVKQDYQNVTTGFQQFKGDVNSTFEYLGGAGQNFNTGLQMMRNDMNLSPVTSPDAGFVENAAGGLGIGYDQRMPMFKSDYQNYYGNKAGETAKDVISFATEMGTSFALPALGVAAGMSATAAAGIIAAPLALAGIAGMVEVSAQETLKENANQIYQYMQPTIKNADMSKAMDVAQSLKAFESTDKAELFDIGSADIKATMASFAASGGYSNAFTAEQFKQKTQEMLENFRSLVHTLGMAQEEAAALMGELEAKKIVSPGGVPGFTANLQVAAQSVGIAPTDLLASGMQTTELLKSFGYSPAAAFDFGVDATVEAQRLANSTDPYYKTAIYNVGGVQNALQSLLKNTTQFDNTALGTANLGATDYTGDTSTGGSDPQDILDINAAKFSDPNEFFKFNYKKRKVAESINFTQKAQNMVTQTLAVMDKFGLDSNDKEIVTGFMSSFMKSQGVDMSIDEASLIIGAAMQIEDPEKTMAKVKTQELLNFVKENDPSLSSVISHKAGNIASTLWNKSPLLLAPRLGWEASKFVGYDLLYKGGRGVGRFLVDNVWEDKIVGGLTGKKFFHWEDYKDYSSEEIALAWNDDFFKRLGLIGTDDDRYQRSDEDVDKIYNNLIDMDNSQKVLGNKSRINDLGNFEKLDRNDMLNFLPTIFDENRLKDGNYKYDSKNPKAYNKDFVRDVSAVVDYFDDIMYETNPDTGKKTKTTSFETAEKSFKFSQYLSETGILKNLTTKADKEYNDSISKFDEKLKDFSSKYQYNLHDDAGNYYDQLSLAMHGKKFTQLDGKQRTDLVRYATSEHGREILGNKASHTNTEIFGLTNYENKTDLFTNLQSGGTYSTNELFKKALKDKTFMGATKFLKDNELADRTDLRVNSEFFTGANNVAKGTAGYIDPMDEEADNLELAHKYWRYGRNNDIDAANAADDASLGFWGTVGIVGGIGALGLLTGGIGVAGLALAGAGVGAVSLGVGATAGAAVGATVGIGILPISNENYDPNLVGKQKLDIFNTGLTRQDYLTIISAQNAADSGTGFVFNEGQNSNIMNVTAASVNQAMAGTEDPFVKLAKLRKLGNKYGFENMSDDDFFQGVMTSGNNYLKAELQRTISQTRGDESDIDTITPETLYKSKYAAKAFKAFKGAISEEDANREYVLSKGEGGNYRNISGNYTSKLSGYLKDFFNSNAVAAGGTVTDDGETFYSGVDINNISEEQRLELGITEEMMSGVNTLLKKIPDVRDAEGMAAWMKEFNKIVGSDSKAGNYIRQRLGKDTEFSYGGMTNDATQIDTVAKATKLRNDVLNKVGTDNIKGMDKQEATAFLSTITTNIAQSADKESDWTLNTRVLEKTFDMDENSAAYVTNKLDAQFKDQGGVANAWKDPKKQGELYSAIASQGQFQKALELTNKFYEQGSKEDQIAYIKKNFGAKNDADAEKQRQYLQGEGAADQAAVQFNTNWQKVPNDMAAIVKLLGEISRQLPEVGK